ncbi:hypothetical protein B1C78_04980 [Thioalkalivibrio denitrificans]|uniref:Uncharacterized protein n=1 Tax=Thioalkalivibrio denitrificans TaxID=108003 RepID=A0A1V3NNM3_9GAMM|nr:hypothetical protein B1C78_04980 [Thioalkalivibrio denitrificans]
MLVGGGAKHPPYFNEGGLQILPPEDVLAAMEIKTRFGATELREALERHARNHTIFLQSRVDVIPWQGAFFFECRSPFDANRVLDTVEKEVRVILSSYGPKIDQSSVRRNSLHFPLPTFLVLFETCLIMFRTCDDPSIVHIDLFESESLSFGLAAIDFFSYAASRLSGSTLPTSLELSREYVERYHWHRRTLSIETEK